jgi:serine/threonine-protein kinase
VVLRALAKRPEERFASMDDAVRALEAAARGEAPAPIEKRVQGATEAQRFSTSEVRAVLGKAIEQQAVKQGTVKLGFADLLAIAAEVGVDADSLREASRALRAGSAPATTGGTAPPAAWSESSLAKNDADRDVWIRRQRRDFHRHAGVYVIVNAALLVLGLILLSFTPWWIWFLPGLAWGVGLAIHGMVALTANKDDWSEHQQEMHDWHESRRRRHEERMAAIHGGRRGRQRIEAPPRETAAPERVRVDAVDTGREQAAEDEAVAAEPRERGRRRR